MRQDIWIERFIEEVLPRIKSEFKPTKVVIFGSRVKGVSNEDSDIDVIIVSKNFENIPFLRRMPFALRVAQFSKHIDFICYTPEEFERILNKSTIVMTGLKEGIEVAL